MKLCKDCRWMNEYLQCENPQIPMLDPVEGKHHVYYCKVARVSEDLCGQDARYFEATS